MKTAGNAGFLRGPRRTGSRGGGLESFTLIELLAVMAVIVILASLVLSLASYLQTKGAQSRAQAEVQAIEAACESYKSDNGSYPVSTGTTNILLARSMGDPVSANATMYQNSSFYVYSVLTGDTNGSGIAVVSYLPIKPTMCARPTANVAISGTNRVQYLMDPWGNSYGYSTSGTSGGYNPTFDLWSTAGNTLTPNPGVAGDVTIKWIKNW